MPPLEIRIAILNMLGNPDKALGDRGISLVGFITALSASLVVFGIQTGFFLLLRNKLARIL
jgi:calcium permeable stress-gated cation channel